MSDALTKLKEAAIHAAPGCGQRDGGHAWGLWTDLMFDGRRDTPDSAMCDCVVCGTTLSVMLQPPPYSSKAALITGGSETPIEIAEEEYGIQN